MSLSVLVATSTALQLLAAEGSWPDNSVGLCCSDSKLNCSCPRAPTVVWDACPQWHVGNNTIGSGVYDASGVLRQPDGTWHMFPDGGKWGHCTSLDLMHWDCSHPSTGFGSGDTGGISVTPKGTFALWPGIQMAVPTGPDLDAWVKKGKVDNGGGQRDPGRAILLKSGWYVPEGVTGIHWFRDESNGSMSRLNNTGTLVADGTDGFNEFERWAQENNIIECPDVFELDGKVVVIASFSNRSHGVYTHCYQWYRVGEMSEDDLKFVPDQKSGPPDRLDYGAVGISTIYAGKTGTSAFPPFTRRVLVSFTGYGNRYLTNCGFDDMAWYSLPRELSLSATGKLLQHPVREAMNLRKTQSLAPTIAPGSQVEMMVICERPDSGSWPASGLLAVKTLETVGQALSLGYEFAVGASGSVAINGFADVPASLSVLGARKDRTPPLPDLATATALELRVFVDGHMTETFYGGYAVITTITSNTVPSANVGSALVNPLGLKCNMSSWTLAL